MEVCTVCMCVTRLCLTAFRNPEKNAITIDAIRSYAIESEVRFNRHEISLCQIFERQKDGSIIELWEIGPRGDDDDQGRRGQRQWRQWDCVERRQGPVVLHRILQVQGAYPLAEFERRANQRPHAPLRQRWYVDRLRWMSVDDICACRVRGSGSRPVSSRLDAAKRPARRCNSSTTHPRSARPVDNNQV